MSDQAGLGGREHIPSSSKIHQRKELYFLSAAVSLKKNRVGTRVGQVGA